MSVEEKAATEKGCEICSYYINEGWHIGRDEQGLELHMRTAHQSSFSSKATEIQTSMESIQLWQCQKMQFVEEGSSSWMY